MEIKNKIEFGKYGLPLKVQFCKKCIMSNQRPSSSVEFKNTKHSKKRSLSIGNDGICEACKYAETKLKINWNERNERLIELCERFRKNDGSFDVIIPGSGGKDSVVAAHVMKYEFNMNPLLVTWPPALYTDIGRKNFEGWLEGGFSNYTFHPNRKVHKILTQQAFLNLCHPFQPFILGQKNLAPRIATQLDIPLVIYGENEAEYGNPVSDNDKPKRSTTYFSHENLLNDLYLGGVNAKDLKSRYGFTNADLSTYLPVDPELIERKGIEVHYLGFYRKWHPQQTYYFSVEKTKFMPNIHRTEGTHTKYASIDDKMDWLHYYTAYIKFGIGRTSNDTAQEIRNKDITREEGIALVKRFDGEFPKIYLQECLDYMEIDRKQFDQVIEQSRPEHLWHKVNGIWELKHPVWKEK